MADKSLTFNLFGKDVSASKAVSEFGDKTRASVSGMLSDLARLAIGFIGITGAVDFGKQAVDAALAAQTANEKLDLALKNTHSSLTANSTAVQDQVTKMSDFGFTGTQTADALRVLTTGLGNSTEALSLMQVTADLATYKNISLSDSALIVTKGMEGQLKPLKQLGIDLPVYNGSAQSVALANEKVAKAQQAVNDLLAKYPDALDAASKHHAAYEAAVKKVADAQQLANDKAGSGQQIIDALSQKLSGEASKAGETFAGKLSTLNAKWDDLQVKVGTVALPVLSNFVNFLNTKVLPDLDNLGKSKGPDKLAHDLATALGWKGSDSAGPLSANGWANGWDQLMAKFGNGWDQWMGKFQHGTDQMMAKSQTHNGALGNGWDQLMTKFGNGWDQWGQKFGNGQSQMNAKFSNGWSQIQSGFGNGLTQIETGFSHGWTQIQDGWNGVTTGFGHGWTQIEGAFSNGWTQISGAAAGVWSGIETGFNGVVGSLENGWAQIQAFISGHPVQGQIQYSNVVPPPPSGGGGATVVAKAFASGGVVRARPGGLPALIGEGGVDEAVLPLDGNTIGMLASRIAAAGGGSGGSTFNIYEVHDPVGTANAVMRRLDARGAV